MNFRYQRAIDAFPAGRDARLTRRQGSACRTFERWWIGSPKKGAVEHQEINHGALQLRKGPFRAAHALQVPFNLRRIGRNPPLLELRSAAGAADPQAVEGHGQQLPLEIDLLQPTQPELAEAQC